WRMWRLISIYFGSFHHLLLTAAQHHRNRNAILRKRPYQLMITLHLKPQRYAHTVLDNDGVSFYDNIKGNTISSLVGAISLRCICSVFFLYMQNKLQLLNTKVQIAKPAAYNRLRISYTRLQYNK